jgi:hypothetical protein
MNALVIFLACLVHWSPGASPAVDESAGDVKAPTITAGAAEAMESVRKRYQIAPGMTILTNARWVDPAGDVVRMERARAIFAPTGDLKVMSPTANWTLVGHDVYAESQYFPGMIIRERSTGAATSKLQVLDRIWPFSKMPIEVRLRLAMDTEEAFAPFLTLIGPDGTVESSTRSWSDGASCTVIEFRSADQTTLLAVWIDVPTGLLRGVRGTYGTGALRRSVEVVSEPTETPRPPKVLVATVGRREFSSYAALAASWAKSFAVPSLPAPAVTEAVSPLDGVSSDPTPSE